MVCVNREVWRATAVAGDQEDRHVQTLGHRAVFPAGRRARLQNEVGASTVASGRANIVLFRTAVESLGCSP
jgi:hypothetical protein